MGRVGIILLTGLFICCIACKKEDPRNVFVGAYSIHIIGSRESRDSNVILESEIDARVMLLITLDDNSDAGVKLSGYYDANAVVKGNSILIDPTTVTYTDQGYTWQETWSHEQGTLSDNVLTFYSNMTGQAVLDSLNYFNYGGRFQNVATKY